MHVYILKHYVERKENEEKKKPCVQTRRAREKENSRSVNVNEIYVYIIERYSRIDYYEFHLGLRKKIVC